MIVGTGIDIEQINRVARLIEEHAARLDHIFTPRETAFCEVASTRLRLARYAAAFAAKEAVMKALGTGWIAEVEWMEIDTSSMPHEGVVLYGATARFAESQKVGGIRVSISTTRELVIATAITESVNNAIDHRDLIEQIVLDASDPQVGKRDNREEITEEHPA